MIVCGDVLKVELVKMGLRKRGRKTIHYIIVMIWLIILMLIGCGDSDYRRKLDTEVEKYFSGRQASSNYISKEDIVVLLELEDNEAFLSRIEEMTKRKELGPQFFETTTVYHPVYNPSQVMRRLLMTTLKHPEYIDQVLRIFANIYSKKTFEHALLVQADYQIYYMLIEKALDYVSEDALERFVQALPDDKSFVLINYWLIQETDMELDAKAIYEIFESINNTNFRNLLAHSPFMEATVDFDESIDRLAYYYELRKLRFKLPDRRESSE